METLKVDFHDNICKIQLYRPDDNNKINAKMVCELQSVLESYGDIASIVLLEGLDKFFCMGADFNDSEGNNNPELLYDVWNKLATGSFVSICHIKGQTVAGGMGFVTACDVSIADINATFCLSELLFGLFPAMVLPFFIRRAGIQAANYMTLMTKPILAERAYQLNIIDAYGEKSDRLLHQHLARLSKIPKDSIKTYKNYINQLNPILKESRQKAVEANVNIFKNEANVRRIKDFVDFGKYPWE